MSLDTKTKDIDANEELLQYRKKQCEIWFIVFFFTGWTMTVLGAILSISPEFGGVIAFVGIGLMVITAYFLILTLQINILIYLKRQFEKGEKSDLDKSLANYQKYVESLKEKEKKT